MIIKIITTMVGPYKVTEVDDVNTTLKLPRKKTLKVYSNRLKPFFG
jgi:hypothetical protein